MPPSPSDLLLWALVPAAAYYAANALASPATRLLDLSSLRLVTWLQRSGLGPVLGNLLRFAFYLGIPYAALVTGSLDTRALGLTGSDPAATVALAAAVSLASLAIISGARRYWAAGGTDDVAEASPQMSQAPTGQDLPAWHSLTDAVAIAVAMQAHLALYRAALLATAGRDLAPFVALALLAAERAGGAAAAGRWDAPRTARLDIEALACVATGGIVLWGANSLPGAIVAHAVVSFGLERLRAL